MATNPEATLSTASGIARHIQGDVVDLQPSKNLKITKRIPYDKDNQTGADYLVPVWLTGEHGATFGGSAGSALTLNGAEVAESKNSTMSPTSLYFQSRAVIDLLAAAIAKGDRAAEAYIGALMRNTKKGINKRREIKALHGGGSLGTVATATDGGTTSLITINAATWASGIWLGMRNCPIAAYNGSTLLNDVQDLVITKVDPKNHQLTVSGESTDIDALVAAGTSAVLYLKSQYGNTGLGVRAISRLRSGDSYLGITCATYADVFCATQSVFDIATTAEFTWQNIQDGLEEAIGRGLERDLVVEVPPKIWATLNGSLDALRVFDSGYSVKSVDMGHDEDAIKYHSMGIDMKVEMSTFMFNGEVIAFPDPAADPGCVTRVGNSDLTFNVPGQGDDMFQRIVGTNVCEWMAYCCDDVHTVNVRDFIYWGPTF